jgi:hypothetical protein
VIGFRWAPFLAAVALLAACGGSDDGGGSSERTFGFITAADPDARTIDFDAAEWLTGDEAAAAAVADGNLEPGEPVPNDYYIRNTDKSVTTLDVASDASIKGAGPVSALRARPPCESCSSYAVGVDEFFAAWKTGLRPARGSYWVTVEDDEVVAIEEQYRP